MLVNSIPFWIFFPIVVIPYFLLLKKSAKAQNLWLLIASYAFYGYVELKMIPVILIATIVFYLLGIQIQKDNTDNPRRATWLTNFSVVLGVGMLVYFKYLNFLIEEFAAVFEQIGLHTNMTTFKILMPLGISYFTFKLMSYTIEIHRKKMEATHDPVAFATFVAFFPTLMAGPIDRPNEFLPQLQRERRFNYDGVAEGFKRILWGMFLKMCIADQISGYTNVIIPIYQYHNASSIILASVLLVIQSYADFCGYSEMALGVGRIMGIKIRENFNHPFWGQNVAEYWRRWHMSLTTWLTDYVFMPLCVAFRNMGNMGLYLATIINLVLVGLWHGANWTYGLFGLYHGVLLIIITANEKRRKRFEKKHNLKNNVWYTSSRRLLTFVLWTIGVVLFNCATCTDFFKLLVTLTYGFGKPYIHITLAYITLPLMILFFQEYKSEKKLNIHFLHSKNVYVRIFSVIALVTIILLFGNMDGGSFIYYKF